MKTLEELRRIDEGRPVARLAKLVEDCACIAVVGGGVLLVVAFATAHWQTSALVFKLAGGICAGGIGAYCISALLHNPRRRRGSASPMRRANARGGGARRAKTERDAAPGRKGLRPSGLAARADRYRMELKRDKPLRAIHLVGVFGTAGFALVGALLKGTSSGWDNALYTSLSAACLFGMIVCLALALLPTALRIGRLIVARGPRPRRGKPLDGPSEARRSRATSERRTNAQVPAAPSEDARRAESHVPGTWEDGSGGRRPHDSDAPHAMRLVGLLGAFCSVLVGALLRGMADGSTYLLHSAVSYACFIGLVVSAGIVVFPGFAARFVERIRTRQCTAVGQDQGEDKGTS